MRPVRARPDPAARHRLAPRDPSDRRPDRRCGAPACSSGCWGPPCRSRTSRRCPARSTTPSAASTARRSSHVEGRAPNEVSGELNLTTVGVSRGGLSLVQAILGWFDDEVSVVPEESVYPPGPLRGGDPAGQPRRVPQLRAGRRDRRPGAPGLPGEDRGAGPGRGLAVRGRARGGRRPRGRRRAADPGHGRARRRPDLDPRRLDDHRGLHAARGARHARRSPRSRPRTGRGPCSASRSSSSRRRRSTSTSRSRTSAAPPPG